MDAHLKVLCVDDNEDAAHSTGQLLELAGCDVWVCHDGPTALSLAEEFSPDVYVIDLAMPGIGGGELAVRLLEQAGGRPVRFIALTGLWDIDARHQTHNAGFEQHLVKPADPERLIGAVRDAWDSIRREARHAAATVTDTAGDAWGELTGLMRRYPFGTLAVGIGIGFLLSRLLGGRDTWDFRRLGPSRGDPLQGTA